MGRRRAVSKPEGDGGGSKRRRTSPTQNKNGNVKGTRGKSRGGGKVAEILKPAASSSGNSNDGGTVHPLLIPHIIEKVLEHIICPKTDKTSQGSAEAESSVSVAKNVHNLRLVCKQWKEIATRLYRRKIAPWMSFGKRAWPWNWGTHCKSPDEKMQNFLDVMKNSALIPIQRYSLIDTFFIKENQKLMNDFMRICGPDMVELEIFRCCDHTMKFTRRSFPPGLNLKGLKKLTVTGALQRQRKATDIRQTNEIAYLIDAVIRSAETLQEFYFTFFATDDDDGEWRHNMAKCFGEVISKRIPRTVKALCLQIPLHDLHLITLAESELKLKVFQLDAQSGASSMAIRKFLEKQTATLKGLTFKKIFDKGGDRGESRSSSVPLDFPRLEELLILELVDEEETIQQFSVPDTFPKLHILNIKEWKTESTFVELFNYTKKKGLSLKEIHLPYSFPQAPLVKKAAQCFPNISKLHISRSRDISETLQEVFVYFSNIKELYISFPKLLPNEVSADSILSGVSEQDCRQIKEYDSFDNVNIGGVQLRPSILNLTKLKKLVFSRYCATDFAAHFLFLRMDSMSELHFNQHQMSTKYFGLLCGKLTLDDDGSDFDGSDDDGSDSDGSDDDDGYDFDGSSDDDWQNMFDDSD